MLEGLEGKTVLITGATGFLGTALAEGLLRKTETTRVVCLIRPGRTRTAEERLEKEVLSNDCFGALRSGPDWERVRQRVSALAGDVSVPGLSLSAPGREVFATADVVVHSAATVSFESPFPEASRINLAGPVNVYRVAEEGGKAEHFISISTAYVQAGAKGKAPEATLERHPLLSQISWDQELRTALSLEDDAVRESFAPEALERFVKEARRRLGSAGESLVAREAERIRLERVRERLVEAGRSRARMLGFPDVYAYTKALGEVALIQAEKNLPVTIVRPSIIEASLFEPFPGWIKGFRMADPIIVSFGRGLLQEFPGIPEGVIDVVPVDLVVNAVIAVAATGPRPDRKVYHVASGDANPLKYRQLVHLTSEYFREHPLYDAMGQPIEPPSWSFPGMEAVGARLEVARRALRIASDAMRALGARSLRSRLIDAERRQEELERAMAYARLYGSYTETEAVFSTANLKALQRDFPDLWLDPARIDWRHYAHDVYLPAVIRNARPSSTSRRKARERSDRLRRRFLVEGPRLAVFDLEGTIVASDVVATYLSLLSRRLPARQRWRELRSLVARLPVLVAAEKADRGRFLRHFYRLYEGWEGDELAQHAKDYVASALSRLVYPSAVARIRLHKRLGHTCVLVTGALPQVAEGFAPLFDAVLSTALLSDGPALTGELAHPPYAGQARLEAVRSFAESRGLELAEAVAYGDSSSDLPMLEAVGNPVAVNPDLPLAAVAARRGWLIENWRPAGGARDSLRASRLSSSILASAVDYLTNRER